MPNNLVLLVRGELFKRYPNAIVYAGKAKTLEWHTRPRRNRRALSAFPRDVVSRHHLPGLQPDRGGRARRHHQLAGWILLCVSRSSPRSRASDWSRRRIFLPCRTGPIWHGPILQRRAEAPPKPAARDLGIFSCRRSWRLARGGWHRKYSHTVLQSTQLPNFLRASQQPTGIAIVSDSDNPDDTNNQWGVNSAQTAYILLRLPFRILIHADLMLPPS